MKGWMMRDRVAVLLQLFGVGSLVIGAGIVHVAAGFIVAGVGLVLFGVSVERD